MYQLKTIQSSKSSIEVIQFQLRNLVNHYGLTKVTKTIQHRDHNKEIDRHLTNLWSTYGLNTLHKAIQKEFPKLFPSRKVS